MKHITYATEKRINEMKKKRQSLDSFQEMVIRIYDGIFSRCSMYGATLKELEQELGHKLDANMQVKVSYFLGIHGVEHMTNGNARYVGTHDLSYLNIDNFNLFVKQMYNRFVER